MAKNYECILAPVDGGEDTMPVLDRAIELAKQNGSHLDILNVKAERKKVVLPTVNSKKYLVVEDISQANMYDVTVTLTDTAKITKDGAVVGGNKIKMGLPVVLEGESYKFGGTISDVRVTNEAEIKNSAENSDVG